MQILKSKAKRWHEIKRDEDFTELYSSQNNSVTFNKLFNFCEFTDKLHVDENDDNDPLLHTFCLNIVINIL